MPDDFLTLHEAAARSGLSASHLRLLARTGRIEARKFGRDWFTSEAALRTYLANEYLRAKDPLKRSRGKQE